MGEPSNKTGPMSRIKNILRGSTRQPAQRTLMKQSLNEGNWMEKAVDILVLKIRKQPDAIKNLETALATQNELSKCVTIPRAADGRIEV